MPSLNLKTGLPAIFISLTSVVNLLVLSGFYQPASGLEVLGGPDQLQLSDESVLTAISKTNLEISDNYEDVAGFALVDSSFLNNPGSSLSNVLPTRDGLMIYKVQSGDNLSKIAANFGISLNTIYWANPNLNNRGQINVGQELVILPVSGVTHQVQEGDSLSSLAALYEVDPDYILKFNKKIIPGQNIIIPGAKPAKQLVAYSKGANLPNLAGYFSIPTTGWNWGRLHYSNAVDIANACGTPIYAAAEGLVVEEVSSGWNHGYGNTVVIEHPNSVKTRYAHNQKNNVAVGQYVLQGDLIGFMGNTGNTHGPTGCHIHFEVVGAQNPFAKR